MNSLSVKSGDFFLGCLKYPLAIKYWLVIRARQQRSVILAKTEMKKKLYTDDEGMISDYESEPEMSEEHVLKYLENEMGNSKETLPTSIN